MRLYNILKEIQEKAEFKENLLKSKKGKDFEQLIESELTVNGDYALYNTEDFKKLEIFQEIKEKMQNPISDEDELLIFEELIKISTVNKIMVRQPFGKQQSPDLLLINSGRCLGVELKFTEKKVTSPVWNSGFPRPNFIYIFGSFGLKDVTFFKGDEIASVEERIEAKKIHDKYKKLISKEGEKYIKNLSIYFRPMYNQIGNVWNSEERKPREERAKDWALLY